MSLQINLAFRAILDAYQDVLNSTTGIDWAIFTYEGGTNDMEAQAPGSDGLEGLKEEFYDDRIQYALVRVIEPHSKVPNKKGLFYAHSGEVVRFLKEAHIVVSARNEVEADVAANVIMKKVKLSSVAKYSVQHEAARKFGALMILING
ncbi:hypothetical protein DL96DRAFT_1705282 [Flagelloscypha sp. PMI_526]|nr:hypothetical protein DL96DRAFT_1705282 [Flagelloscypha sp. PMI_526]